jgi:hypothetical protein
MRRCEKVKRKMKIFIVRSFDFLDSYSSSLLYVCYSFPQKLINLVKQQESINFMSQREIERENQNYLERSEKFWRFGFDF